MKLDKDLIAIDNKHQHLLKGSPVKFERENFVYENSPTKETERRSRNGKR